jgi:hypothetical protein
LLPIQENNSEIAGKDGQEAVGGASQEGPQIEGRRGEEVMDRQISLVFDELPQATRDGLALGLEIAPFSQQFFNNACLSVLFAHSRE